MSGRPSLGTMALLLIRLDARAGDAQRWLSVHDLAALHRMPLDAVRAGLQALWDDRYIVCQLGADGQIAAAAAAR